MHSIIPTTFHWKKEWTSFLIIVLILRVIYAAFGIAIIKNGGPVELDAPVYTVLKPYLKTDFFSQWFVNPWFQWDTVSYYKIAMSGYGPGPSIAFMPLYPLLIRFTAPLFGGNYLLAALTLSTVLCSISLTLLYELFSEIYPQKDAWWGVLLFITFPTAFFLLAAYTESLFLTLVLAFWHLARKRRWWLAALCAGLATLTRLQGVILTPVMLWMMLLSLVEQPESSIIGQLRQVFSLFSNFHQKLIHSGYKFSWLAALTPVAVGVLYQSWLYRSGLGVMTDALQTTWRIETVMPWEGVIRFLQRLFVIKYIYMDWIDLALFGLIAIASVIGLWLLNPAFSLYIWSTLAVLFTRGTPPHLLASFSRYFLALFPLFILPTLTQSKVTKAFMAVVFFFLQLLLAWIFLWGSWVA